MIAQSIAFWSAATAYALASVLFFVWLAFRRDWARDAGLIVAALGLAPLLGVDRFQGPPRKPFRSGHAGALRGFLNNDRP